MSTDADQQGWFKSSYSGPYNNSCLEARFAEDGIEIRDSKDRQGATLRFGMAQWSRFLRKLAR